MSNPETVLMNQIRVGVSDIAVSWRANVGKVRMADGRFFDTGLPKGFPDVFGFRRSDNKIFFLEIKTKTGRLRKEQKAMLDNLKSMGCLCGVARSVEEARKIIND